MAEPPPDDDSSSCSSESSNDSLALDGAVVRRSDAESSSDDDSQNKEPSAKRPKIEETIVDFTFHDMQEEFYHGLQALLHESNVFRRETLQEILDNKAIGTVVCSDANVYAFASIVTTNNSYWLDFCQKHAPKKQPYKNLGVFWHARMLNLPLAMVGTLYEQLTLDLDFAAQSQNVHVDHLLRLAPCILEKNEPIFRFFDDEIWLQHALWSVRVPAPRRYSQDHDSYLMVMLLTRQAHAKALQKIQQLIK